MVPEKLQNETLPDLSFFPPEIRYAKGSEFSPNFWGIFRALFRGTAAIATEMQAIFHCQIPRQTQKKGHRISMESRPGKKPPKRLSHVRLTHTIAVIDYKHPVLRLYEYAKS